MSNYKTLSTKGKEIFTDVALHPGEILNDELKSREKKKLHLQNRLE
jgi:antitoxin HigA-1